jgi:hypothetical protein
VVNTSDKFGVTQIILDVPDLEPIIYWIPPLETAEFEIPDPDPTRDIGELTELKESAIIYTARKPKHVRKLSNPH